MCALPDDGLEPVTLCIHPSSSSAFYGVGQKVCLAFSVRCYAEGLPWWLSGKESACQCRRHLFNPWSGKIPHSN